MDKEPLNISIRAWISALAPAVAVIVAVLIGVDSARKANTSLNLLRYSNRLSVESEMRPYLHLSFDPIKREETAAVVNYHITNSGKSSAFAVRPTIKPGPRHYPLVIDWQSSSAFAMIAPDRKADYSTRLDNYFSSPAPRFIHFLCTYQYKYPNITDSAGTQGDSTTEFVLMATLIDNGTELRGLGSNEIRVVDPKFVTLAQYKHPDYFVE